MANSNYGYTRKVDYDFQTAVEKVRASLAEQGFGILTEIDVKATLKKKLDKDVDDYMILGACNPNLALQALEAEKEIGLIMPCNVIVYKQNGEIIVSAMMPVIAMSFINNPELKDIAEQAESKLKSAIDNT